MLIALNYRHRNERIEEALHELGHTVRYNLWDIREIVASGTDAVLFEFKLILKEELRFLRLSHALEKAGIPRCTWCLDLPNIGASAWKLFLLFRVGLVDIFATHSLQKVENLNGATVLYLPNAAWLSRYNMNRTTLEELRNPDRYSVDVSFMGNIDSAKHPEHRNRTGFLNSLAAVLEKKGITYRFEDSRHMDFEAQIRTIQTSRINLTAGCAADRDAEKSWGLAERCYGIPACGGFLMSDERVHAHDDFIEGEEIVMYRGLDDCVDKLVHYLGEAGERRRIAENAHKRVLREHTYKNRAERLIGAIQTLRRTSYA
jgi:spore maturation protein CgeB